MPGRASATRVVARIVAAVVAVWIGALALGAARADVLPSLSVSGESVRVRPVPGVQERVCPGSLVSLGTASGSFGTVGSASIVRSSSAPEAGSRALTPGATLHASATPPTLVRVPAPSGASRPPLVAATQAQSVGTEQLEGLTAVSCTEPGSDAWLVAGASDVGSTSVVELANPTSVAASVDLTIFGETGRVSAPGASGITVAPGERRLVALAGLAPDLVAPVVHVEATGGTVSAALQQTSISGITPTGAELVSSASAASEELSIPGVVVADSARVAAQGGSTAAGSVPLAVRLVAPERDTSVRVGATAERGGTGGTSTEVELKRGIVTEVPLTGLGDGSYTVTVSADAPVVAAARSDVQTDAATDFAWAEAATPLTGTTALAVPDAPGTVLHVANPAGEDLTAVLTIGGSTRRLAIPAGSAVGIPVTGGATGTLEHAAGLVASISASGDGTAASLVLSPPSPAAEPIVVRPR